MPKFESSIKVGAIESLTGNTTVLHLGADNRVGIGTTAPETKLHVGGAITATGLILPPGVLSDQGDSAASFGFNPNFSEWNGPPENSPNVANGYSQTGSGVAEQSSDSNLGGASARFNTGDVVWSRSVRFASPLYANVFIQGTMTYKYEDYTAGEPGLEITLTHRERANSEFAADGETFNTEYSNTFIVPTLQENRNNKEFITGAWRAHTPGNREITELRVRVISSSGTFSGINDGGSGNAVSLGGATDYDWYLDGFSFSFMHPDMRIDQFGRVTGAYIAAATIDDLHIKDMISSTSSLILDNPTTRTSDEQDAGITSTGTGLFVQGLVSNSSHANGWSISKSGTIKATDIEIFAGDGTVLIDANAKDGQGNYNPFARWTGRTLADFDPSASSYLYGLSFEESNSTGLRANVGFLATSGEANSIVANTWSVYFANTVTGTIDDEVDTGGALVNSTVQFNGISYNAPPGTIFTGGKQIVKNQDAYILFLANTQKWDSEAGIGTYQNIHANSFLGDYGVYVLGKPTVGGWVYHPHGNNAWYTIDSTQTGSRLHENDFLVIGRVSTNDDAEIRSDTTYIQSPKHPDSVTSTESQGSYPPIGITAGGLLFADIHINQWAHTANAGEVQLTNKRNLPNTRFTFIHPGTNEPNDETVYTVNGSFGILTSLEQFPGSRYITFIGGDKNRTQPSGATGFNLDTDHSPDFVAAFPIGTRWFYNTDEGSFAEFSPSPLDCIVARVDSNGSSISVGGSTGGGITNIYRYAEREAVTSEGATISDMIIDPPRGMASGGLVLADFEVNKHFNIADNTFTTNSGFIAITNDENNPRNEFYVIHPDNGNNWLVDTVSRGVVTSLNPNKDVYGTRHLAFVGDDPTRFPASASYARSYYNVSNSFVAVSKYDAQGNPRADGKWYYDAGYGITEDYTFTPIANDFIVATLTSFDPSTSGIDQITRWAAEEGQLVIDGVPTTITSIRNLINARIDVANTMAQTALSEAQSAYANAVTAQVNAAAALGLLDGAITVYFQEEGEDGDKFVNAASHSDFDYNDLWINISPYNEALDGSWYSNAIFRYANQQGGFESGYGDADEGLAWRHDPTNPSGRAYLTGLTARGFADRSTTIYYRDRITVGGTNYGPNVAVISIDTTDSGKLNFNPEGDLWYDTAGDDNHPYVYRTNATFSKSNTTHIGYANGIGTLGHWAQTAYTTKVGSFNFNTSPSGWYDTQDAAFTGATDSTARADATKALSLAANAHYAADREIIAYFQVHTDIPTATGNGDIWIHTDNAIDSTGTKNTGAIFIANNKTGGTPAGTDATGEVNFWHQSELSAIGLMYLESYSAGVSGAFNRSTNMMPRGLSLFDQPISDYKFLDQTATADLTGYPEPYAFIDFQTTHDSGRGADVNVNTSIDTSYGYIGPSALQIQSGTQTATSRHRYVYFANTRTDADFANHTERLFDKYGIDIPKGKKFIVSYYSQANGTVSGSSSQPYIDLNFHFANSTHYMGYTESNGTKSITQANVWQRNESILDFTQGQVPYNPASYHSYQYFSGTGAGSSDFAEVTRVIPFLQLATGSSVKYLIDAVQLEEVPNTVFTASEFKEPSDGRAIVFGREITDGKIVTHYAPHSGSGTEQYGPIPNTTPTGLPNPQPHGDFWVDTANNNIVFRYHQQSLTNIPSSQTVYWTSDTNGDGWYTTEDLRAQTAWTTGISAVAAAETAQAAADREIVAFFQTDVPTATGNGDIWIDTDSFATLNTSSIYVAFTQGATATAASPTPNRWYPSPDSAIGQVYLNAYLADRRATRAESLSLSVTGSADLPFPVYPDANGIFVGATGNIAFWKNSTVEGLVDQGGTSNVGHVYATNRGGRDFVGPNGKIWYSYNSGYGIPETGLINTNYFDDTTVTNSTFSSVYLMYTNMNASTRFLEGASKNFGDHDHFVTVIWNKEIYEGGTWQAVTNDGSRYEFVPDAANGDFLVAQISRPVAAPEGLSTLDSWVFKTLPVQSQAITDGKIVTHYGPHFPAADGGGYIEGEFGPQANLTPTGLYNPDPHGDFWVNTSNNNIVFRYHANSDNKWAQTAYHAPIRPETNQDFSGWYSTEDLRTANAENYTSNLHIWLSNTHSWASYVEKENSNNVFWVNLALANAAFANGVAYDANAAAYLAQAAADREILAFFAPSTGTVPDATGNGDVWIHTDTVTSYIQGTGTTKNTLSIFVANTHSSGPWKYRDTNGPHYWYEAPNNAIGLMYLESYVAGRDYSDGRVVTHYFHDDSTSPSPGFGPNPNTTPTGVDNPEPDGDLWVDTGNNYVMYRYHNNGHINYAQTAYYNVLPEENLDASSKTLSGWYALEDPRIANNSNYTSNLHVWLANTHSWASYVETENSNNVFWVNLALANAIFANGVAYNANAAAYLAQAAADREIIAYFKVHTDIPNATGNGDIWIHTDNIVDSTGAMNSLAIFVANTKTGGTSDGSDHFWHQSPYNAIGLAYAKSYIGGISSSTNLMPRGYSLWDAPLNEYSFNVARASTDILPEPYAINYQSGEFSNVAIERGLGSNSYLGQSSLRLEHLPSSASDQGHYVIFGGTLEWNNPNRSQANDKYRIEIPKGKRWIFSYYARANTIAADTGIYNWFYASNSTHYNAGSPYYVLAHNRKLGFDAVDEWQRHSFILDFTSGVTHSQGAAVDSSPLSEVTSITPVMFFDSTDATDFYIDGMQLEEVAPDSNSPTTFKEPSEHKDNLFGREMTDGKLVTQYFHDAGGNGNGPRANVTPTGLPNPQPHGDFWVDTVNNHIMYQYHQFDPAARIFSSTSTFAQTAYYDVLSPKVGVHSDGWYALQDPRLANTDAWLGTVETTLSSTRATAFQALQDAASAASAADAELIVFFEPSTNSTMVQNDDGSSTGPATGNGDIWIKTDLVYDADGNPNPDSIFYANLHPGIGWSVSPDNAIGRGFLENFTSAGVKNWFPSGYSTWDESPGDYVISEIASDHNADTPYPIICWPEGDTGAYYAANAVVNTTFGKVSTGSLQLTSRDDIDSTAGDDTTYGLIGLANTRAYWEKNTYRQPDGATFLFPRGKRWIFSYYAYSNSEISSSVRPTITYNLYLDNTANNTSNVVNFGGSESFVNGRDRWHRFSAVIDLSNTHPDATASFYHPRYGVDVVKDVSTNLNGSPVGSLNRGQAHLSTLDSAFVRLQVNGGDGNTVHFDGFQWEEAPGAQILAGPFSDPDRRISTRFTRTITDGKIVTHYRKGTPEGAASNPYFGPRPQITPSGVYNDNPDGDFWIDTANNNALYRYNANSEYSIATSDVNDTVAQTSYWGTIGEYDNQVGWYSVQDGRIATLTTDVASVGSDVADQLRRIKGLEATSDGELQIFFNEEGGEFVNALGTYSDARYGDLWINVSGYNQQADGTLYSNAIFRWQNSSGSSSDYTAVNENHTGKTRGLAWRHAPNNAVGKIHLLTYAAQNTADAKITAYYEGHSTDRGNRYLGEDSATDLYGPQANLTPTKTVNRNPDGDIWINTANNNEMYVFHRNIQTGGSDATGYRQKVYWTSTQANEGWYSAEDLRVGTHQIAIDLAKGAGGDRMVEVFFAPHTSMQDASGNGDIWIHTDNILNNDGTPNTGAIFVGNTLSTGGATDGSGHYWHQEPNSALGRSHLERLVAETGSNFMPRGLSLFDSPVGDYNLNDGTIATGNELYAINSYTLGTTDISTAKIITDVTAPFGDKVLELSSPTHSGDASTRYRQWIFSNTEINSIATNHDPEPKISAFDKYGFSIPPNSKWIFSTYLKNIDEVTTAFSLSVFTANATHTQRSAHQNFQYGDIGEFRNPNGTNTWKRAHVNFDLTTATNPLDGSNTHNRAIVGLTQYGTENRQVYYHALQLEDVTNSNRTTPSAFQEPSPASEIDFSRAIADGKTIYFISNAFHSSSAGPGDHKYGPDPSTTPNGLTNPEPYGDKWISMSPPYKTYLYFSNSTNKTSQTAHHAPKSGSGYANTTWPFGVGNNVSGWYEYRDTGDALTQEGFQVSLGQIAIGSSHWVEGGQSVIDNLTFDPPNTDGTNGPPLVVTGALDFGPNKELLLNPVPPPDTNLHAHWTLNSYDVDDDGNYLVPDVSGRNNHAKLLRLSTETRSQSDDFVEQDPAEDVINVSGNRSLFMQSNRAYADKPYQTLILGSNGSVSTTESTHTYKGSNYPVDITDAKFDQSTLTFWWKPSLHSFDAGSDKYIVGQDHTSHNPGGGWSLRIDDGSLYTDSGDQATPTANNDIPIVWYIRNTASPGHYKLQHKPSEEIILDGWYGANDGGTYTPIRANEWHFIAIQSNHDDDKQSLWIYREGEGLLYYNVRDFTGGNATTVNRGLALNGMSNQLYTTYGNSNGHYDEVRLYNSILTPRNIRYLYMNPTGRPRQLQPRPGIAVKKGYAKFEEGMWGDNTTKYGLYQNSFAYFHGYDVDGNPADVNPYISFDGNVKYLKKGKAQLGISHSSAGNSYFGNTGYILYNDTAYFDAYAEGTHTLTDQNQNYVFAMPIGSNSTQTHTWMYQEFWDNDNTPKPGWRYFTPDDSKDIVIGEAKLANLEQMIEGALTSRYIQFDTVDVYQFARKPSVVRESYNFTISPSDFIDNFGGGADTSFFANSDFWESRLPGTFIKVASIEDAAIKDLSADKIQAGTIEAKVEVGGEAKILIDGPNSRIIISD